MSLIVLLVLCSVLIFLMAIALARELRVRRSYERLLSRILQLRARNWIASWMRRPA